MNPRRTDLNLAVVIVAVALSAAQAASAAEQKAGYIGRPIYSDPVNGLQLPPACIIEPTWRERISGTEMEVWVLNCDSVARVWLLMRQIVEMLNAREARVRFQVVDERELTGETAGESLSVQCTGATDASAIVVYGARWRSAGHELRLAGARGALRADVARRRLVDADLSGIDCVRFPDREAMMRKLQQTDHSIR
ncbi:MAG TPA: hypothetical protein VGY49_08945 [Burkholderiaceae bacterium]|nr:hypothetical protein [Burkholderiaceae bacterium]